VIKGKGEQLTKTVYDRLGRAVRTFVLASDNDSVYADADEVAGDYVLQESDTYYVDSGQGAGNAFMQVSIDRYHDDTSTTGQLNAGSDLSLVDYSGANIKGRAQIVTMFYDDMDRASAVAARGTAGGSNYDRDSDPTVPARSDTILVTSSSYDDAGRVYQTTDPRGIMSRTLFDDAGRRIASIANYVNGTPSSSTGDDDVYTRYVYSAGRQTQMWVDIDGDNVQDAGVDQVTTYTYGVAKGVSAGDSSISSNRLRQKVTYPDSGGSSDVVTFAYNALGQEMWKKDQAGSIIQTDYDTAGRIAHKRATTIAGGLDTAVARISMTYTSRGQTSLVTQ